MSKNRNQHRYFYLTLLIYADRLSKIHFPFTRCSIRSLLFSIAFTFSYLHSSSQNKRLDSLQNLLKTVSNNDTLRINILTQIGRSYLYDFNNVEKMKQYATQVIKLSQKTNYKKGFANGYLYYGVYFNGQANYDYALAYYMKALKLFEELKDGKSLGSCYINIGTIYGAKGNYKDALLFLKKGAQFKQEANDKKGTSIAFNNIGNMYSDQGKYPEALDYLTQSLKLKEDINDKSGISISYNNIALIYELQGKRDDAIAYHFKSLKLKEELDDKIGISVSYSNLATLYTAKKLYNEALKYDFLALKLKEDLGEKQGIALCLSNIGTVYSHQKNIKEALKYQIKAFKLMEEMGYEKDIVTTGIALGNTYEQNYEFEKALEFYEKALKKAKDIDFKEGIKDSYGNISSAYKGLGNYPKALEYNTLYYQEKDSLLNKEVAKQVTEINTKYQTEKKEQEIQLLTKDQQLKDKTLREQRVVRIALIVGLGLFFILSFTLYNRYRFKQKANTLLEKQKKEIQEQNILITDSIDYAKTIQEAVFPSENRMKTIFPDSFVLYKPKAIVSGDFYQVIEKNNKIICTVADCTGHGIPGAFMSLLGFNMLENIIERTDNLEPAAILTELNQKLVTTMSQNPVNETTIKHGMDATLIQIDKATMELQFAGAHNSLYQVRNNALHEIKADKISVGSYKEGVSVTFRNHIIPLRKGDVFYLFSDGFPDQIGGPNRKKFYYPPFKELLLSIHQEDIAKQKAKLDETITAWRGERDQTDDILIVGIRI